MNRINSTTTITRKSDGATATLKNTFSEYGLQRIFNRLFSNGDPINDLALRWGPRVLAQDLDENYPLAIGGVVDGTIGGSVIYK